MAADYLKLFLNRRLNVTDHLEYIKGKLATMKIEDPNGYKVYSEYYGVEMDVQTIKEPEPVKRGRKPKTV